MLDTFSILQIKSVKSIVNMYETGSPVGRYDTLVILGDGAGITYGKTQTTENGGGLWKLIFEEYERLNGKFLPEFRKYKNMLYNKEGGGSKGALTQSKEFKDLLVKTAREDELMKKAQDMHFHRNYFRPALQMAEDYEITQPLILATIYDIFIHSGPKGGGNFIEKFDEGWDYPSSSDLGFDPESEELTQDQEVILERAWGLDLIKKRDHWLRTFTNKRSQSHTNVVRKSAYRTKSLMDLAERQKWLLEPPFFVKVNNAISHTITKEVLEDVF